MAVPGFDLRGAWTLSTGWRGGGRKSLKVLMVEVKVKVKVILRDFDHISINIMLRINRERSERRKIREKIAFWA